MASTVLVLIVLLVLLLSQKIYEPEKKNGSIRYILGGVIGLAPFNFLTRPATKYDV